MLMARWACGKLVKRTLPVLSGSYIQVSPLSVRENETGINRPVASVRKITSLLDMNFSTKDIKELNNSPVEKRRETAMPPRGFNICWNCNEEGHLFTKCPQPLTGHYCQKCGLRDSNHLWCTNYKERRDHLQEKTKAYEKKKEKDWQLPTLSTSNANKKLLDLTSEKS